MQGVYCCVLSQDKEIIGAGAGAGIGSQTSDCRSCVFVRVTETCSGAGTRGATLAVSLRSATQSPTACVSMRMQIRNESEVRACLVKQSRGSEGRGTGRQVRASEARAAEGLVTAHLQSTGSQPR